MQVVFVTGKPEYAVEAFDIEVTDYLVKPFDEDRLNRCIQRLLKKASTLHINRTRQTNLSCTQY
ncbi:MAG: hypothetical protein H0Z40_12170 [Desulfotomaculum sp.]|nr:hypothetical protein [Desulfotomaculum sp.]